MKKAILYSLGDLTFMYKRIEMKPADVLSEIKKYKKDNAIKDNARFVTKLSHIKAIMDYYDESVEGLCCGASFFPELFEYWNEAPSVLDAIIVLGLDEAECFPDSSGVGRKATREEWLKLSQFNERMIIDVIKKYCYVVITKDVVLYKLKPCLAYAHPGE